MHGLRDLPHVVDIRTIGLIAGVELAPQAGAAGRSAATSVRGCFERGPARARTGDIIALSPPLIVEETRSKRSWRRFPPR